MTSIGKDNSDAEPQDFAAVLRDLASLRDTVASLTLGLGKEVGDSVAMRGGRAARAVEHQVAEQPVLYLLLAFGLGALGSRLLLR